MIPEDVEPMATSAAFQQSSRKTQVKGQRSPLLRLRLLLLAKQPAVSVQLHRGRCRGGYAPFQCGGVARTLSDVKTHPSFYGVLRLLDGNARRQSEVCLLQGCLATDAQLLTVRGNGGNPEK